MGFTFLSRLLARPGALPLAPDFLQPNASSLLQSTARLGAAVLALDLISMGFTLLSRLLARPETLPLAPEFLQPSASSLLQSTA